MAISYRDDLRPVTQPVTKPMSSVTTIVTPMDQRRVTPTPLEKRVEALEADLAALKLVVASLSAPAKPAAERMREYRARKKAGK